MNEYLLLTGATGLLGRYLVKDLLNSGVQLAVLVRRSRKQSAEERVDSMLATWEQRFGHSLKRPVVLEGDLSSPSLGLNKDSLNWIEKNVDSVLHNAASLSFQNGKRNEEPWLSNVDGLSNMLKMCERTQIGEFHHVSTSYVAGLREGIVYENELDVGQEFGNDYERSKVEAEKMVRESSLFDEKTFYRPSIIIGDSDTGFTSTFHGFYAVMRLGYTLLRSAEGQSLSEEVSSPVRLTLTGDETKNLVPVNWVSEVMSYILCNREHHGKTYHLTPRNRVTASLMHEIIEACFGFSNSEFCGPGEIEDKNLIECLFYEHMQTYESYWRDDPEFDASNTKLAAPHLPCPEVNYDLLLKLTKAVVDMKFRFTDDPVPQPVSSEKNHG